MELDRNALLVYLSNLRMLETVIYESNNTNEILDSKIESINLEKDNYIKANKIVPQKPSKPYIREAKLNVALLVLGIITLIVAIICIPIGGELMLLGAMAFLSSFCSFLSAFGRKFQIKTESQQKLKEYNEKLKKYEDDLEKEKTARNEEQEFMASFNQKLLDINSTKSSINTELQQWQSTLDDAYSLNIIPMQFRNIHGIYYLYDYLSTSNETLTNALIQANLDSISTKLDKMINLQGKMIIQQAQASQTIFAQNNRMLSSLRNIEEYTKISAINSEVARKLQENQLAFQEASFILEHM